MFGLAERLEETFKYPTQVLNPFKSIALSSKVDGAKVRSLGPALAVAVGLALRGV
jgi:Tfp pilus assembly PilM family ATPase